MKIVQHFVSALLFEYMENPLHFLIHKLCLWWFKPEKFCLLKGCCFYFGKGFAFLLHQKCKLLSWFILELEWVQPLKDWGP